MLNILNLNSITEEVRVFGIKNIISWFVFYDADKRHEDSKAAS